jgi:hypothetical protein
LAGRHFSFSVPARAPPLPHISFAPVLFFLPVPRTHRGGLRRLPNGRFYGRAAPIRASCRFPSSRHRHRGEGIRICHRSSEAQVVGQSCHHAARFWPFPASVANPNADQGVGRSAKSKWKAYHNPIRRHRPPLRPRQPHLRPLGPPMHRRSAMCRIGMPLMRPPKIFPISRAKLDCNLHLFVNLFHSNNLHDVDAS